jgi:hypothetical protein
MKRIKFQLHIYSCSNTQIEADKYMAVFCPTGLGFIPPKIHQMVFTRPCDLEAFSQLHVLAQSTSPLTTGQVVQGLGLSILGCGFNTHSVDRYFVPVSG